jgi:hypothetical protein
MEPVGCVATSSPSPTHDTHATKQFGRSCAPVVTVVRGGNGAPPAPRPACTHTPPAVQRCPYTVARSRAQGEYASVGMSISQCRVAWRPHYKDCPVMLLQWSWCIRGLHRLSARHALRTTRSPVNSIQI